MNKIILALIAIIVVIAFFTNPKDYKYKSEVKSEYESNIDIVVDTFSSDLNKSGYELGRSFGYMIAENQINSKVNVDNYLLFSVAKWEDNYIGYGMFGSVFISDDFKNRLESISSNN